MTKSITLTDNNTNFLTLWRNILNKTEISHFKSLWDWIEGKFWSMEITSYSGHTNSMQIKESMFSLLLILRFCQHLNWYMPTLLLIRTHAKAHGLFQNSKDDCLEIPMPTCSYVHAKHLLISSALASWIPDSQAQIFDQSHFWTFVTWNCNNRSDVKPDLYVDSSEPPSKRRFYWHPYIKYRFNRLISISLFKLGKVVPLQQ